MLRKLLIIITLLLTQILVSYSVLDTLDCDYTQNTSIPPENILFYGHNNLSSNVALGQGLLNLPYSRSSYDYTLSCHSNLSALKFYSKIIYNHTNVSDYFSLCGDDKPVMFITDSINARVSINTTNKNITTEQVLCASVDRQFSNLDVRWHIEGVDRNIDYTKIGYTCMFRTNDKINGHVSTCDSNYNLSVWARLFEDTDFLVCDFDCTSKLDRRVYSACASKIPECRDVPTNCDGALYGSWVPYNETHEIKCSDPWTTFRPNVFTNSDVIIESRDSNCKNIIKKEFAVLVDNEQVTMAMYVCQGVV